MCIPRQATERGPSEAEDNHREYEFEGQLVPFSFWHACNTWKTFVPATERDLTLSLLTIPPIRFQEDESATGPHGTPDNEIIEPKPLEPERGKKYYFRDVRWDHGSDLRHLKRQLDKHPCACKEPIVHADVCARYEAI